MTTKSPNRVVIPQDNAPDAEHIIRQMRREDCEVVSHLVDILSSSCRAPGQNVAIDAPLLGATDFVAKDRPVRLAPAVNRAVTAVAERENLRNSASELHRNAEQAPRLATTVEQTPDSIVITDAGFHVPYVNPAFELITGYREERPPRPLEVQCSPPEASA